MHIQTGYLQSRAWACGSINNAGQTFAVGGGIHQMVGGAIATSSVANVFFGSGGTAFVGSGQLRWIGIAQARAATAQTNYGAGMVMYNGAGMTNFIYVGQASAQVGAYVSHLPICLFRAPVPSEVSFLPGLTHQQPQTARAQFCAANDIFNGAGWHTSVNTTRFAAQVANAFYGVGNQIWVGAGGAAFIRCYTTTRRLSGVSSTRFLYTVAGTGITRLQGQRNIVVTKNGQYLLPFQPTPKKRGLFFQSQRQQHPQPQPAVRTLSGAEEESALATDSLAVQLLMGETVKAAGQNAFFNPEGRSKLLVVDTFMQEGKQQIVEDPELYKAANIKDTFGGLPALLAQRAEAGEDSALAAASGAPATLNPGLISANNTECMLCSVGPGPTAAHAGGPDTCHVSDACGGAATAQDAVAAAKAAAPAGFDFSGVPGLNGLPTRAADGSVELPDIYMLWHEMVVYCHSTDPAVPSSSITDKCLSANYVKDVVRAYLGPEHANDYQLAVASAGLDAAVKPLVEEEGLLPAAMAPEWNPECQGWTKFNVYMTANDAAVQGHLARQWEGIVAAPADFEATLLQNANAANNVDTAKVTPCSIAVKRVGAATYPSIKNMKGFKPLTSELAPVGPSVILASDSAIAPVAEVAEGQEHTIFVQNFMKGAKVSLQLVKGLDRTGPVVAAIDSFEDAPGAGGMAELKWTPPAGLKAMEKPGEINKYYLRASVDSFPAFFANSQAFTLSAGAAAAQ